MGDVCASRCSATVGLPVVDSIAGEYERGEGGVRVSKKRRITGFLGAIALAVVVSAPATAAPSDSRERYVAALDPVCKRDAKRTSDILRGSERLIRNHKLKRPARNFARAARNFDRTLKRIGAVDPPAGDRAIVNRWLRQLKHQSTYLRRMSKVLRRGQEGKVNRIYTKLLRNSNKANNTVFLFDFKHCLIVPGMYR